MSLVNLTFRNRNYALESDDPGRVEELAKRVERRVSLTEGDAKNINDNKLLFMSALMAEDELDNVKQGKGLVDNSRDDEALVNTINGVASYIEELAEKIEKR